MRGLYVRAISSHPDEKEFLLPHGQRYRFLGKKRVPFEQPNGKMTVLEVWQFVMQ